MKINQQRKILVRNRGRGREESENGMCHLSMHINIEFYFVPLIIPIIG